MVAKFSGARTAFKSALRGPVGAQDGFFKSKSLQGRYKRLLRGLQQAVCARGAIWEPPRDPGNRQVLRTVVRNGGFIFQLESPPELDWGPSWLHFGSILALMIAETCLGICFGTSKSRSRALISTLVAFKSAPRALPEALERSRGS